MWVAPLYVSACDSYNNYKSKKFILKIGYKYKDKFINRNG